MTRLIIVIDATIQTQCQDIAVALTGNPADNKVWEVGLSADGNTPATHYWCNWEMNEEQAQTLQSQLASYVSGGTAYIYDASQYTPEQVLADRSLTTLSALEGVWKVNGTVFGYRGCTAQASQRPSPPARIFISVLKTAERW